MHKKLMFAGLAAAALGAGPALAAEIDTGSNSTDGVAVWSVFPANGTVNPLGYGSGFSNSLSLTALTSISSHYGTPAAFTETDGSVTYTYGPGCCASDIQQLSSTGSSGGKTYLDAASNYDGAGTYFINDDPGEISVDPFLSFSTDQNYISGIVAGAGLTLLENDTVVETISDTMVSNAESAEGVSPYAWQMNRNEYSGSAEYLNVELTNGAVFNKVEFTHLGDASVGGYGATPTPPGPNGTPMPALGGTLPGVVAGLLGFFGLGRKKAARAA